MFKGIVVERGRCDHCRQAKLLAHIPSSLEGDPYEVALGRQAIKLCAACIYRLMRTAATLVSFERPAKAAKAKQAPKKTRKPRTSQPGPDKEYQGPPKHEVHPLIPENLEPSS